MTRSTTRSFAWVTPPKRVTLLVPHCLFLRQQPDGPKISLNVRWPAFAEKSNRRLPCIPQKKSEVASFMNLHDAEKRLKESPLEFAFMSSHRFDPTAN